MINNSIRDEPISKYVYSREELSFLYKNYESFTKNLNTLIIEWMDTLDALLLKVNQMDNNE